MEKIKGSDLKAGDIIQLWYGQQRIVSLRPYTGCLSYLFNKGAQIAELAPGPIGITIDNNDLYDLVK